VRIEVVAVYLRHVGQWRGGLVGLGLVMLSCRSSMERGMCVGVCRLSRA
jgi:hypothetical protein